MNFRPLNSQDENELNFVIQTDYQIPLQFDEWQKVSEEHQQNRKSELKKLSDKDYFIICEEKNSIIGFHYLQITKWNFEIAMIITTWVHPSHRGLGIAKKMKEMGEEWARKNKVKRILTGVHIDNTPMNNLNLASGFILRTNGYMKEISI